MLPWQQHIIQLNYQNPKVCVIHLLAVIFGDERIKGFREKGKWNTGIKNYVPPLQKFVSLKELIIQL